MRARDILIWASIGAGAGALLYYLLTRGGVAQRKGRIELLYEKAYGNVLWNEYGGFIVYENMASYFESRSGVLPPYPNAATIVFGGECKELKQSVRDEIASLGFTLEDVDHQIPSDGVLHDRRCYIKWRKKHFTRSELFLDRIEELAKQLGYDVRSVSKTPYWGIYGGTISEGMNQLRSFCDEIGLKPAATDYERRNSGCVCFVKSWYLHGMYAIFL